MSAAKVITIRAQLWMRGGQCGRCTHALWGQRGRVTGCAVGAQLEGELGAVARILAALLFRLAQQRGAQLCVARDEVPIHPDAYLAEDRPPP